MRCEFKILHFEIITLQVEIAWSKCHSHQADKKVSERAPWARYFERTPYQWDDIAAFSHSSLNHLHILNQQVSGVACPVEYLSVANVSIDISAYNSVNTIRLLLNPPIHSILIRLNWPSRSRSISAERISLFHYFARPSNDNPWW